MRALLKKIEALQAVHLSECGVREVSAAWLRRAAPPLIVSQGAPPSAAPARCLAETPALPTYKAPICSSHHACKVVTWLWAWAKLHHQPQRKLLQQCVDHLIDPARAAEFVPQVRASAPRLAGGRTHNHIGNACASVGDASASIGSWQDPQLRLHAPHASLKGLLEAGLARIACAAAAHQRQPPHHAAAGCSLSARLVWTLRPRQSEPGA